MDKRIVAAALGAALLTIPAVAAADPGHSHGKAVEKKATPHKVTFVFKGRFTAPGTLEVVSGNAHVRKGGFVGRQVSFDFTTAKVVAADTNGDQKVELADVKDGDLVLVQARIAKRTKYAAAAEGETASPIAARKLIDRTNAPSDDDRS